MNNWAGRTILVLMLLSVYGCSNKPTMGERMMADSKDVEAFAEMWNEGSELVMEGEKRQEKGERQVAEGKEDIRAGKRMVEKGRRMMEQSERIYQERSPTPAP